MSTPLPPPAAPTPDDAASAPAPTPGDVGERARADGGPASDTPAEHGESDAPVARAVDVAHPSRVRRAPRYGRFALLGFLLGAAVSLVLALVGVSDYSTRDVFLILLIGLGTAGIFAGLVVALIADRRSVRRRG